MERYRVRANFDDSNNLSPTATSFQTRPPSQISIPPKPPISFLQDAELSIFDAKRYFNETPQGPPGKAVILGDNCSPETITRDFSVSSADGYAKNWRTRSFRATPTASSEASWNSQTGLLSNLPGAAAVNMKAFPLNDKRKTGSPSLSAGRRFFGRNCPCSGKKSVVVEEKRSEPKSPVRVSSDKVSVASTVNATDEVEEGVKMEITPGIWAKESTHRIINTGFSFPILTPPPPPAISGVEDPARDSLEVFRPSSELTPNLHRLAEFPRRLPAVISGDDDAASDTSSDLFEIESFSANSAYRRCDSLDEYPKVMGAAAAAGGGFTSAIGMLQFRRSLEEMTECYAPSEVSVEWSVTTAEGGFDRASIANFSSAASDYDENRFIRGEPEASKKKGAGGLLSCRCENSVNVGPSPVRVEPGRERAGTAVLGVEPELSRFALEKAVLVRSASARMKTGRFR